MKKLFFLVTASFVVVTANSQVVINEIMQSNIDCIMDDLNDFPDSWVELYNSGSESVDLSAFSLSDKKNPNGAWQLPAFTLEPGKYAVVYCDKAEEDWETYKAKNKRDAFNWHTPFRLESGKNCSLFLFKDGEVVDKLEDGLKKQPAPNIAYGRKDDGGSKWGYQAVPTPGAANCGTVYSNKDILGEPVFSDKGRVFTGNKSVRLKLSVPEDAPEGTVVRYTLDGSEPTEESPVYSSIINIRDTRFVRAKLFCEGKLSRRSTVHSYIKMDHDMTLPVFSIVTDDKYLNDQQIGIYVSGNYIYPGFSGWGDDPNEEKKNYFFNWRRPMNYELFEKEGEESVINQLGEARITGAYTRREALKSLCLYANKRFGDNKRLLYEFFPDQRPGITDYKSIILRNAGNDHGGLYMRDAIVQCSMAKYLDLDWQAWRPSIVFINGEYKGILNIRERSNEDNIYTNYHGLEDIDMVENPWVKGRCELKEGTMDSWNAFEAFYTEKGHTYAEYNELLDVQEFMDVMIFNAFFCNTDFPGNNIVFWRPQTANGRWRMLVKDTDFALGIYGKSVDTNYFSWLYKPSGSDANQEEHTRLFRHLMEDEDFNREFIDRSAIYMGDFMNLDRVWETWEPMYEMIKYEYSFFKPSWGWWGNPFENSHNEAKNWLKQRTDKHYNHLNSYFKAGTPRELTINKDLSEEELAKNEIFFNGWKLSRGIFNGKFFQKREVTLKGENVKGWKIKKGSNIEEVEGNTLTFTMPAQAVSITAIFDDGTGIDEIDQDKQVEVTDIFDASGVRLNSLQKGLNIIRTSDGKTKSVWK